MIPKEGRPAAERAMLSLHIRKTGREGKPDRSSKHPGAETMTDRQVGSQGFAFQPLVGMEEAVVDDKGRVRLSTKKLDRLGQPFVLHADPLGCLVLYPRNTWHERLLRVMERPAGDWERDFELHDLCAMAEDDVKCDGQGRFVIPQRFRDRIGPKSEVVILGCGDHVQIWTKSEYETLAAKRAEALRKRQAFVREEERAES